MTRKNLGTRIKKVKNNMTLEEDVTIRNNILASHLDDKLQNSNSKSSEEEKIKELVSELKVNDEYKLIKEKIKKELEDEEIAKSEGFESDNYYSAKQNEDGENDKSLSSESRSSLGSIDTQR